MFGVAAYRRHRPACLIATLDLAVCMGFTAQCRNLGILNYLDPWFFMIHAVFELIFITFLSRCIKTDRSLYFSVMLFCSLVINVIVFLEYWAGSTVVYSFRPPSMQGLSLAIVLIIIWSGPTRKLINGLLASVSGLLFNYRYSPVGQHNSRSHQSLKQDAKTCPRKWKT